MFFKALSKLEILSLYNTGLAWQEREIPEFSPIFEGENDKDPNLYAEKYCNKINSLCELENVFLLSKPIDKLCKLFKFNQISQNCIQKLIKATSFLYLIDLIGSPKLTEDLKWSLVSFFVEITLYSSEFCGALCKNEKAFHFLLDLCNTAPSSQVKNLSRLLFNLAAESPNSFPLSILIDVTNRALKCHKEEIISINYSFFMINLFRFGPIENNEFIAFAVNLLGKWVRINSEITLEHIMWCLYYWFKRTPDFIPVFYETFIFDFVFANLHSSNEVLFKLSLSMCSMALITANPNYINKLNNFINIQLIISLFHLSNDKEDIIMLALSFCSNYAGYGPQNIEILLNYGAHAEALSAYDNLGNKNKVDLCFFLTVCINRGTIEQARCFDTQGYVDLMNEMLEIANDELAFAILNSFEKLVVATPEVKQLIDRSAVENVALSDTVSTESSQLSYHLLENIINC